MSPGTRRSLVVLLLGLLARSALAADPTIEVRARMRLHLEREEHTAQGGLIISGTLVEEAMGEPMPGGFTVALSLARVDVLGRETNAYAEAKPIDIDGGFRFVVPHLARDVHILRLAASGYGAYAAPTPLERTIDMSRRDLELRLHAPSEHPVSVATLPVVLEAVPLDPGQRFVDGDRDRALPVELEIDGHAVATVMLTDGRASTALALPQTRSGKELVLRARFTGDEAWAPTETSVRVRLVEASTLTLEADRARVTAGDEVTLSGRLHVAGKALSGVSVVIRRVASPEDPGDAPFVTVKTDADGAFRGSLRAPTRAGAVSFEASFPATEAKERGLLPATSELVVVEVTPGISFALFERKPAGLALAIVACVAIGLLMQRVLRALRARRARLSLGEELVPTAVPPRKLFATLRIARDRRVEGRVRDAERRRPLPGARLRLRVNDGEAHSTITDEEGRFSFKDVASGGVELFAEADGHAPSGTIGQVPHRGELAQVELELMPLRGELLRRYDEVLGPFVAGDRLGKRTPRELAVAALRHRGPKGKESVAPLSPELIRQLRKLIEERCFGDRPVGIDALAELEKLAEKMPSPPAK